MKRISTLAVLAVLLVTAALIWSCKDKKSNPVSPGGPADVTITINGFLGANSYSPNPDTVTVGQTVSWRNSDGVPHTATSNDGGATFNTNAIGVGATSAAKTMSTAGSFPYHCTIHGLTMAGTLVVKP